MSRTRAMLKWGIGIIAVGAGLSYFSGSQPELTEEQLLEQEVQAEMGGRYSQGYFSSHDELVVRYTHRVHGGSQVTVQDVYRCRLPMVEDFVREHPPEVADLHPRFVEAYVHEEWERVNDDAAVDIIAEDCRNRVIGAWQEWTTKYDAAVRIKRQDLDDVLEIIGR